MMTAAFKSMDPSLEESAMMSGAIPGKPFDVSPCGCCCRRGVSSADLFVRTLESFETRR